MKNRSLRSVHLFLTSLLFFLLHLPFSFARSKPLPTGKRVDKPRYNITGEAPFNGWPPVEVAPVYQNLYDELKLASMGLARQIFNYAVSGYEMLREAGRLANEQVITIVDFSRSSREKRLFVIDLKQQRVLFNTYVAHGVNSGKEFARAFSNRPESNQSSLGFYTTAGTYQGKHGYSLYLNGLEKGINDLANHRDIVVHGAEYVSEEVVRVQGYLGRSHGCPAIPQALSRPIIDRIKNGSMLFIFGEDPRYPQRTALLRSAQSVLAAS